ncbi:MAG: LysR family transcriptional regulator [Pseudomonadota bacterium]
MNWQATNFDWNQARAFLATAEEGSLSAAARALGLTQPTLSRQVAGLEETLGVVLFERVGRSVELTDLGRDLLEHFRAMGQAADRAALTASAKSEAVEGAVTITATNVVSTLYLPAMLKRIRREAPALELIVVASNDTQDLQRREADIAIRHARPEQPDLVAKLIGETTAHLYASKEFLDRFGRPDTLADVAGLDFIGFETPDTLHQSLREIGLPVTRENFKLTTASGTAMLAYAQHGLGIAILPTYEAQRTAGLERVLPDLPAFPVPVWLVAHRELATTRRIRLVFDILAEELAGLAKSP